MRAPTVLGVGNVLMCDEGLGVRAAELLRERAPESVRVVAAGGLGPKLLGDVEEASLLLVLDCVDAGAEPGTVLRVARSELLSEGAPQLSPHEFGLVDLLALAMLRGREPEQVVVLGIQPARIEPGVDLSPEVAAAMPRLVSEALNLLDAWLDPGPSTPGAQGRRARPVRSMTRDDGIQGGRGAIDG